MTAAPPTACPEPAGRRGARSRERHPRRAVLAPGDDDAAGPAPDAGGPGQSPWSGWEWYFSSLPTLAVPVACPTAPGTGLLGNPRGSSPPRLSHGARNGDVERSPGSFRAGLAVDERPVGPAGCRRAGLARREAGWIPSRRARIAQARADPAALGPARVAGSVPPRGRQASPTPPPRPHRPGPYRPGVVADRGDGSRGAAGVLPGGSGSAGGRTGSSTTPPLLRYALLPSATPPFLVQ